MAKIETNREAVRDTPAATRTPEPSGSQPPAAPDLPIAGAGEGSVLCPECGQENSPSAYFCTTCHHILIHRCPVCWHEQRAGGVCEKCGINFAVYWEQQLEQSMEKEDRIAWDKFWARAGAILRWGLLPFSGLRGIAGSLAARVVAWLVSLRLSNR